MGNLIQTQSGDATDVIELPDEHLLLVPTVVFGFSLVDKVWRSFSSVSHAKFTFSS